MTEPERTVPADPHERAADRIIMDYPVDLARRPTAKGTVAGPKDMGPPPGTATAQQQATAAVSQRSQLRIRAAEYLAPPVAPDPAAEVTAAIGAGAQLHAEADEVLLRYNPHHGADGKFSSGGGGPGGPGGAGGGGVARPTPQDFMRPGEQDTFSMIDGAGERLADNWGVSETDLDSWIAEDRSASRHFEGKSFDEKRVGMARRQLDQWQGSSGGPEAVAAITGVADRLGAHYKLDESERVPQDYIRHRPSVRRAVESYGGTMYSQTQGWFTDRGITHIEVERVSFRGAAKDDQRPFTSWSVAGSGGYVGDRTGGIIRRETVPVQRVMSIPPTGYGTLAEMEVVLLPPLP